MGEKSNKETINEKVWAMNYDPAVVLAFSGNTISKFVPRSGEKDGDKYVVITKEKHTMNGDYELTRTNSNLSTIYPGALLVANSDLVDGAPTPLATDREPVDITIDLPALVGNNVYPVKDPDLGNVNTGIAALLENWYRKQDEGYQIPVRMEYKSSILYDAKAMSLKFGCDVEAMSQKLGLDFDMIEKQEHSAYLVHFKQIFYTVSAQQPKTPADYFKETVKWEDLAHYINEKNPPVYVANVQYGREIFFLMESDMHSEDLRTLLESHIEYKDGKIDINSDLDLKKYAKSIKCTLLVTGGSPKCIKGDLSAQDWKKEINTMITEHVILSKDNPGVPLCYTVAFLKDNKIGDIYGTSQYLTSTSQEFLSGELRLKHTGAYVAKFNVSWEIIESYDQNGNEVLKTVEWPDDGSHRTAGYSTVIQLPANAKNIKVRAQGATGLVWEKWRTSVNTPPMPLLPVRSVKIGGTTLHQTATVDPDYRKENESDKQL